MAKETQCLIRYDCKTDLMCKRNCQSIIEGIFKLFIPQQKVYMQEIVD